MVELFKTNNPVELSWAKTVLEDAGIPAFIFDLNINFIEGNIGIFPRRVMVNDEDYNRAESFVQLKRQELESDHIPVKDWIVED
ncbi:MAG: DUF2007 domain-containing protein [Magnetococcales bacterium]|nr:DUF2007 domain-containing protein [Magnetococcales bacterium]